MRRRIDTKRVKSLKPHHTTIRFMRQPAASVVLVLALGAMAPSTLADIVDIAWGADGRFERSVSVAPGKFAEVCGKLPAGLKVGWNFEASATGLQRALPRRQGSGVSIEAHRSGHRERHAGHEDRSGLLLDVEQQDRSVSDDHGQAAALM